ncbi:MAG TPA: chromate efflux transporter [Anaerolineaceae bacterium]|nr:chromate efflux transporter [Anaerolineaceae bacterium]
MDDRQTRIGEVMGLFFKLGLTAFGGPAAHIAMMHTEVVKRRKWLSEEKFLDLLGATNLIPGPNSTEMAIHIGYERAGWAGLILGGACFIFPAMLIVLGLAWLYTRYGSTPQATWLLYGVKPVIIAIILKALWDLGKKAIKGPLTAVVGLAVFGLYFLQVNELGLLLAGGLVVMVGTNLKRLRELTPKSTLTLAPYLAFPLPEALQAGVPFQLGVLFLTFLKIGAVLYGSGYVLLAFLRADFVNRLGWLSDQQLIDAIAVGQITPGPVFTTATFIGYLLGGTPGALLATLGIFLPSFVFVAASNPLIPKLRGSVWVSGLLDGVIIASLGLMAGVTVELGRASLVDPLSVAVALVALALLVRFQVNSNWLVLGGAVIGLGRMLLNL